MLSGRCVWSGSEGRDVEICWSEPLLQPWRPLWRYNREHISVRHAATISSSAACFLPVQHLRRLQAEVCSLCGRSHLRLLHSHWWLEASPWCHWPEWEDKENDHDDDDDDDRRIFQTRIKNSRFSCLSPSTGPSAGALPLWPTGRAPALRTVNGTLPPSYSPRWRLSSGLWYPTVTEREQLVHNSEKMNRWVRTRPNPRYKLLFFPSAQTCPIWKFSQGFVNKLEWAAEINNIREIRGGWGEELLSGV